MSTRVAVLLSGRGSNFLALHDAMERGDVPKAGIALVVSNEPDAQGLAVAGERGLPTRMLPHRGVPRKEHEARVLEALEEHDIEWVCLAGYMRLLSARFVRAYCRRILNIHPSLLPAFPGLEAQRQAWEHGVKISGCTVHLVDEGLDSGPIVLQRSVAIFDDDTPQTLAARILEQEHQAYPEALRRLLSERWRVEGRRVVFENPAPGPNFLRKGG